MIMKMFHKENLCGCMMIGQNNNNNNNNVELATVNRLRKLMKKEDESLITISGYVSTD